jgi:hypothetical protein
MTLLMVPILIPFRYIVFQDKLITCALDVKGQDGWVSSDHQIPHGKEIIKNLTVKIESL